MSTCLFDNDQYRNVKTEATRQESNRPYLGPLDENSNTMPGGKGAVREYKTRAIPGER